MSRINDALKQVQRSQSGQPPEGVPPLTPAARTATGGIGWMVPALTGLLLLGAGMFIGAALFQKPAAPPTPACPASVPLPLPPAPKPVESAPLTAVAPPAPVLPATNQSTAAAVPVVPAAPAPLKLQGITANPDRPSAIISGQIVLVGDRVGDLRVKIISPTAVTLENSDGSLKTLSLVQ